MKKIELALYGEVCSMAGHICHDDDMVERGSHDLAYYSGTVEELLAEARDLERLAGAAGAGTDMYYLRSAQSIREAVQ